MEGRVMGIYIKGFKPQDGLYVIKDGVIRKYKGKGGTVRPYELVEVKEPLDESTKIAVYKKMPNRFHRMMAMLLLGWVYEEGSNE